MAALENFADLIQSLGLSPYYPGLVPTAAMGLGDSDDSSPKKPDDGSDEIWMGGTKPAATATAPSAPDLQLANPLAVMAALGLDNYSMPNLTGTSETEAANGGSSATGSVANPLATTVQDSGVGGSGPMDALSYAMKAKTLYGIGSKAYDFLFGSTPTMPVEDSYANIYDWGGDVMPSTAVDPSSVLDPSTDMLGGSNLSTGTAGLSEYLPYVGAGYNLGKGIYDLSQGNAAGGKDIAQGATMAGLAAMGGAATAGLAAIPSVAVMISSMIDRAMNGPGLTEDQQAQTSALRLKGLAEGQSWRTAGTASNIYDAYYLVELAQGKYGDAVSQMTTRDLYSIAPNWRENVLSAWTAADQAYIDAHPISRVTPTSGGSPDSGASGYDSNTEATPAQTDFWWNTSSGGN